MCIRDSFTDVKRRQVWQEVVAYEEAHEDPVIQCPLQIKAERLSGDTHLHCQVLSKDTHMQPNERLQWFLDYFFAGLRLRRATTSVSHVTWLVTLPAVARLRIVCENVLSENPEMRLVCCDSQHD